AIEMARVPIEEQNGEGEDHDGARRRRGQRHDGETIARPTRICQDGVMSVRIGINPITWSNDDLPELGGETPLETCLAEAREAGYAGIELGNKFPRESAALRLILERHRLALISGWDSGRLLERTA